MSSTGGFERGCVGGGGGGGQGRGDGVESTRDTPKFESPSSSPRKRARREFSTPPSVTHLTRQTSPTQFIVSRLGDVAPSKQLSSAQLKSFDEQFMTLSSATDAIAWARSILSALGFEEPLKRFPSVISALRTLFHSAPKRTRRAGALLTTRMTPSSRQFESTHVRLKRPGLNKVCFVSCDERVWAVGSTRSGSRLSVSEVSYRDREPVGDKPAQVFGRIKRGADVRACAFGEQMLVASTSSSGKGVTYVLDVASGRAPKKFQVQIPPGRLVGSMVFSGRRHCALLFATQRRGTRVFVVTLTEAGPEVKAVSDLRGLFVEAVDVDPRGSGDAAFVHAATRTTSGSPHVYTFKFEYPDRLTTVSRTPGLSEGSVTSLVCTPSSMYFSDARGGVTAVNVSDGSVLTLCRAVCESDVMTMIRYRSSPEWPCSEKIELYQHEDETVHVTSVVPRFVSEITRRSKP